MLISSLLPLRDDNIQEFDTRWNEVLLPMSKNPSDDILESLYKLRIRESDLLKNRIGIVRHGDSSEDIGFQLSKIENHGKEEKRSETSFSKLCPPCMEELNLEPW